MIYYKTKEEIAVIKAGGRRLAQILLALAKEVKPGLRTAALEDLALRLIRSAGGAPAFKDYPMGDGLFFPSALCVSINNEVVHGSSLPDREIKNGDIVDLDIGMEWPIDKQARDKYNYPTNPHSKLGGYFTDTCVTVAAGKISKEARKLLNVTKLSLDEAIKVAGPGKRINDLARAITKVVSKHNYGIVRDLVGHGVGYFAHEAPDVFNFEIRDNSSENIKLEPGMVIAIEPMINSGTPRIKIAPNGYTILTADNSLSAHFEHTVAITEDGAEIMTQA